MKFLKRLCGVEELEKNVKKDMEQMEKNLKTSWNWINYLHELEQDNKTKIKQLTTENEELKELMKNRSLLMNEPAREPKKAKEEAEVPELKKEKMMKEPDLNLKNIDISGIGKKEAFILQILYQLACFDSSSSITTSKIFDNLPYKITKRGLRKKMYKLEEQGAIGSARYGNSRRWFLDMGKLAKLKKFLSARAV